MYLFYEPDADWSDEPPRPATWLHQLGGPGREWADPRRYRWSEGLVEGLLALVSGRFAG
jgi:hypothetical protein